MMATGGQRERYDLTRCDQHIAAGEKLIAEQEVRLARLAAFGHNVAVFEAMLDLFRNTLRSQRSRRELILARIDKLEIGEAPVNLVESEAA